MQLNAHPYTHNVAPQVPGTRREQQQEFILQLPPTLKQWRGDAATLLTVQRPLGLSESGCQSLTAREDNLEGWECESPTSTPRAAPTHLSWGHRASYSPPGPSGSCPMGMPVRIGRCPVLGAARRRAKLQLAKGVRTSSQIFLWLQRGKEERRGLWDLRVRDELGLENEDGVGMAAKGKPACFQPGQ